MAGGLQGGPEARRHFDAGRHEDEHQGRGKAEGPDPQAGAEIVVETNRRPVTEARMERSEIRGLCPCDELSRIAPRSIRATDSVISDRHPYDRAQAAHRAVAEHDVAAMGAGDVAGDRKP